jgi:hypothetical protein
MFTLGREGEISPLTGISYKLRWEDTVQYNVLTAAFRSNARVSIWTLTNKHAEHFMARTIRGQRVTTSGHLGFVVDTAAVRQIFLRVIWFCIFNIIPSTLRTRSFICTWWYVTAVNWRVVKQHTIKSQQCSSLNFSYYGFGTQMPRSVVVGCVILWCKDLAVLQGLRYGVSQMTYTEVHCVGSLPNRVTQEYN